MTEKVKESGHREQDVALSHTEEKDVRDNQSLNSVSLYAIAVSYTHLTLPTICSV